jgi:hypothetical protein
MAYVCEHHGSLLSEWCNDCEEIIECDCSDMVHVSYKDLIYDPERDTEKWTVVTIYHCEYCYETSHEEI